MIFVTLVGRVQTQRDVFLVNQEGHMVPTDNLFLLKKLENISIPIKEYLKFLALEDHPWDLVRVINKDGVLMMEGRRRYDVGDWI